MEIVKKEVKTLYTIFVDALDFANAYLAYHNSPLKDIGQYEGAFENFKENDAEGYIKNVIFSSKSRVPTLDFLVEQYLHFDNVENYGYYDPYSKKYVLNVSHKGNRL